MVSEGGLDRKLAEGEVKPSVTYQVFSTNMTSVGVSGRMSTSMIVALSLVVLLIDMDMSITASSKVILSMLTHPSQFVAMILSPSTELSTSTSWIGVNPARILRCGSVMCNKSIDVLLMEVESEADIGHSELSSEDDEDECVNERSA